MIPKTIGIIGSGVIGLSCALYLQRDGHKVKLFDLREPGTATSFGNAGAIVTGSILPTSNPTVVRSVPSFLFSPSSAVRLKWNYLPHIAPWLFRFLLQSRRSCVTHSAACLHELLKRAYSAHIELANLTNSTDLIRPTGFLQLFRTRSGFESTLLERQLMDQHGINYDILDPSEIYQLEPQVAQIFLKGLFHGESASITSPKRLTEGYTQYFLQNRGEFIREQIQAVEASDGHVRLRGDLGAYDVTQVVIATGAWSKGLCKSIGDKVVLDTERGYHLNIESGSAGKIRRPICCPEDSFVLAPMDEGMRLTSGEELAGLDAPPDFSRIRRLVPKVREMLPGLSGRITREWMGRRPSTPDSLPVIGRSPRLSRVIYAFGHHHLGMTLGPITGRIVAQLVQGNAIEVDLSPYRIERFHSP